MAYYYIAPVRGIAVLSIRTAAISVGVQALTDTVYGLALVVHMMTVPDAGLVDISIIVFSCRLQLLLLSMLMMMIMPRRLFS